MKGAIMAFALTDYRAYGLDISEPVQKRAIQIFECTITGLAADVDLDIGDVAGNAWSAIDGTSMGLAAKVAFTEILSKADRLASWCSPEIEFNYLPANGDATPAATYVGIVNNTAKNCPEFVFAAGEGQTSYKIVLSWTLRDGHKAVRAGW
jgi:hypothetical protein